MKTTDRFFNRHLLLLAFIVVQCLAMAAVQAEEPVWQEQPNRLSMVFGYTWENGEEENAEAEMLGIDYGYRVSEFLSLAAVVEHAFKPLSATTELFVADLLATMHAAVY